MARRPLDDLASAERVSKPKLDLTFCQVSSERTLPRGSSLRGKRILITGAAGLIGTAILPLLREKGASLTLLDLVQPAGAAPDDKVLVGSVIDEQVVRQATHATDIIIHLAGHRSERDWRSIVDVNVESTRVVLDAALEARVGVTILASSIHSAGFHAADSPDIRLKVASTRPDSYYGFSKVAMEALASLYADRFGMRIVCARICSFEPKPSDVRHLSTWLSAEDFVRLVEAASELAPAGNSIIWGVSNNTRQIFSLEAGHEMGYFPQDDAEFYADQMARALGHSSASCLPSLGSELIGGYLDEHGVTTNSLVRGKSKCSTFCNHTVLNVFDKSWKSQIKWS